MHSLIHEDTKNKFSYCLTPFAFLLLLLLLALCGCEKKSSSQKAPEKAKPAAIKPVPVKHGDINLKETKLAIIPENYDSWLNIAFSRDGRQVFYKAKKKSEEFMVAASISGEKTSPGYESIFWLIMSPDGRRCAFGGEKSGKQRLVIDTTELTDLYHHEVVAPNSFSPDSRFVAIEVGGFKEKEWFVTLLDGEKEVYRSRVYPDTYRSASFSPDGRVLVFELGDDKNKEKNQKRTLFFLDVFSRKIIKKRMYTDYRIGRLSFSSDSSRVIYNLQKEGKNFLVLNDFAVNEERTVELPYTLEGKPVLSPDGKHIITSVTKEGKRYLVVSSWKSPTQGKESGPYDAIIQPGFVPGSKAVSYHAMKEGKWRSVVGGEEGKSYDAVGDAPGWSPDGSRIAYPANLGGHPDRMGIVGGKWFMVLSPAGKPAAVKEGTAYDMVVTPVWSPDGKYIAYRARTGTMENAKRFIVIADAETGKVVKEGTVGDEVWPPVWSADSKAVGYGARIGRELWWKVEKLEK